MDRDELVKEISDGRFVSIEFVKANGEVRRLTGRTGVNKTKGVGKSYSDEAKNIVTLFEAGKNQYRSIRADRILQVKCHGKVLKPKG